MTTTDRDPEVDARAEIWRLTYGYLRWLMICLPALLLVVTVATALQQGELETSISAYYGGPVRDVFVGCLVAVAACLVAYQGVGLLEDYALNGAGFYAVFVALVPTGFAELMDDLRANPSPDGLTVADHVWFLRIALTSVLVLCVVLFAREISTGNLGRLFASATGRPRVDAVNRVFVAVTMLTLLGFLVLAMQQLWLVPADEVTMDGVGLGPVRLRIHDLAAIFLIASLAVAVLTNTWPFFRLADLRTSGRSAYLAIVVLMALGPLVAWAVARLLAPGHWVILLEWWEIGLFALFWLLETRRVARLHRGSLVEPAPDRLQRPPLEEPQRPGPRLTARP